MKKSRLLIVLAGLAVAADADTAREEKTLL